MFLLKMMKNWETPSTLGLRSFLVQLGWHLHKESDNWRVPYVWHQNRLSLQTLFFFCNGAFYDLTPTISQNRRHLFKWIQMASNVNVWRCVKNNNTATSLLSFFVLWKFFAPNGLSVVSSVHVSFAHVLLAPNLYPQQQNCRHNDSQVRCLSMFMSATIRSMTLTSVLQCTSWKNSFLHLSYNWNKTSLPAECSWKIIRIRCLARIENPPPRTPGFVLDVFVLQPIVGGWKKTILHQPEYCSSANLRPSYPDYKPHHSNEASAAALTFASASLQQRSHATPQRGTTITRLHQQRGEYTGDITV